MIATIKTAEQLAKMPRDGNRYELVEGLVRMMSPAGGRHGQVAMRLGSLLDQHVIANRLGVVFAAETGFLLATNPDAVRAPDVAFVCRDSFEKLEDVQGYLNVAPDLVAEVVSPNDSSSQIESKAQMWLAAGTAIVLVVDPASQTIRVYRDPTTIKVLRADDVLEVDEVVKGWKLKVAAIFE